MELCDLNCASWNENILLNLNSMRKAEQLCDVKILLKHGKLLLAHSCVLAAASPFFKSVLDGVKYPELDLGDFPGEMIKQVIDFIYTGRSVVNILDLDLLGSVADTLHISGLSDLVKQISLPKSDGQKSNMLVDLKVKRQCSGSTQDNSNNQGPYIHSFDSLDYVETKTAKQQLNFEHSPKDVFAVEQHDFDHNQQELSYVGDVLSGKAKVEPKGIMTTELLSSHSVNPGFVTDDQETLKQLFKIEDGKTLSTASHARLTLPSVLVFSPPGGNLHNCDGGVFTSSSVYIPKHVLFGPYEGILSEQPMEQNRFCWKIYKDDGTFYWLDDTDDSKSNWMKFINHTCDKELQNLEAFQYQRQLYFRTIKSLSPNTELLIRYTDQYGRLEPELIAEDTEATGDDAVLHLSYTCKECNVAYFSDVLYHKHMRSKHGHAMPLQVYLKIQKARGMKLDPVLTEEINAVGDSRGESDKKNDDINHGDGKVLCPGIIAQSSDGLVSGSELENGQAKYRSSKKPCGNKTDENVPKMFTCSVCNRSFKKVAYLKQHEDVHVVEKPYRCPKCGKHFVRQIAFDNHLKRHDAKRKHVCSICGQGFFYARPLEIHLRRHTGERPFRCPTCGRGFTDIGNLDRHKRLHTGEKPYQCATCGKSFTQSGHLHEHVRHHTGDKPFLCNVCGQAFANNSNLQAHTRIHTGERPFVCNLCGKSYRDAAYLKSHKRIHTGEKPYMCLDCGMAFADNSKMRFHRRQKHHAGLIRASRAKKCC